MLCWKGIPLFLVIMQQCEFKKKLWLQKKKAHKSSQKLTFLAPNSFGKIVRALFASVHRFEIRPLALLPTY